MLTFADTEPPETAGEPDDAVEVLPAEDELLLTGLVVVD